MTTDDDWKEQAVHRIEHRLAIACGHGNGFWMRLGIASDLNDNVIYGASGWRQLRDECLKLRDKYTGEYVLAPYIWADLGRRESRGEVVNSADHKKLIAKSLEELNGSRESRIEDSYWWTGDFWKDGKSRSVRAVPVGGASEVDIASRNYKAQPKPRTWDKERAIRSLRNRHYLRGGTSGRVRPSGDMTVVTRLLLKLNRRQRVVYQGLVLREPPLTRAELARVLGIRHAPLSPVQRPGVAPLATDVSDDTIRELRSQLKKARGMESVRIAARLQGLERRARG